MERLRERREQHGLSQATVAEAVNVNPSYIGLLERGERTPSLEVLLALCESVGLHPSELFSETRPDPTTELPELVQLRALLGTWPTKHRRALVRIAKDIERIRTE